MKNSALGSVSILLGLVLAACSSDDDANGLLNTPVVEVGVSGNTFTPGEVRIKVGDIVHWTWSGGHNVVSGANCTSDGKFTSGDVTASGDFEQKFDTVGTFPYFCAPHCSMGMTGVVIVEP